MGGLTRRESQEGVEGRGNRAWNARPKATDMQRRGVVPRRNAAVGKRGCRALAEEGQSGNRERATSLRLLTRRGANKVSEETTLKRKTIWGTGIRSIP